MHRAYQTVTSTRWEPWTWAIWRRLSTTAALSEAITRASAPASASADSCCQSLRRCTQALYPSVASDRAVGERHLELAPRQPVERREGRPPRGHAERDVGPVVGADRAQGSQ